MQVIIRPIESIRPYARNARQIPASAISKVAASIHEFGWRQPIVVDPDGVIVCGHTRLLAAQSLGYRDVPVHVAENLTVAQIRAFRLLDNRSHQETSWDEDLLGLELLDLKELGVDLDLTGFDTSELDFFMGAAGGHTDVDAPPATPEDPISRPGDLWICGEHRILCGDALTEASYERLLGNTRADMAFTDPPYNVAYQQPTRARRTIANDDLGGEFEAFLAKACTRILAATSGAIYVCMSSSELDTLKRVFTAAGGHWSTFIIWAKNTFTLGHSDYQRQFEPILYGWGQRSQRYWCGARNQGDVWFANKPSSNDLHPTMKPVELIERAIENSTKRGALVLDPFAGSGSTLIACEKTGRCARLIELEPKYVDVAVIRWQDFTGRKATRTDDRINFDELKFSMTNNHFAAE